MTAQNRVINKARFEQGDTPQGSDYADLIDSYLSLADTTAQSLASPLSVAGALSVSTGVSAASAEFGSLDVTGNITSSTLSAATMSANTLGITGNVVWTANVTVAAISTGGVTLPASAAGYITMTVSGQTVAIPYFKVA